MACHVDSVEVDWNIVICGFEFQQLTTGLITDCMDAP